MLWLFTIFKSNDVSKNFNIGQPRLQQSSGCLNISFVYFYFFLLVCWIMSMFIVRTAHMITKNKYARIMFLISKFGILKQPFRYRASSANPIYPASISFNIVLSWIETKLFFNKGFKGSQESGINTSECEYLCSRLCHF